MSKRDFDLLIIGAGLSGIGTAAHLHREHPQRSLAIIERRDRLGGTWDLFRYPGIRSDSDMASFGYGFKPWNSSKVLAEGPAIRNYIAETADEQGLADKIHYGLKVVESNWSSEEQRWHLTAVVADSGERQHFSCRFLVNCSGYFNHDQGFRPDFPGEQDFRGQIIHPQQWPDDLDYAGKRVLVIGSGATAVTLVPAMAKTAGHVTMLQRSPSYVFSLPNNDKMAGLMRKLLPARLAFKLIRGRNLLVQRGLYLACRRWPRMMKQFLLRGVRKRVGPDVDMQHFTPKYMPWDERLCAVPDGDLFESLRNKQATIVTGHIDTFTAGGVRLVSGEELQADIVIAATGLKLQMMGGMALKVDGKPTPLHGQMTYKGALIQNIPNFMWVFGYTNAPWTLKSEIASQYLCRLLDHMDARDLAVVTPRDDQGNALDDGIMDSLQSGYVQRDKQCLPRQGKAGPWQVTMHYGKDRKMLLEQPVEDDRLEFEARRSTTPVAQTTLTAAAA